MRRLHLIGVALLVPLVGVLVFAGVALAQTNTPTRTPTRTLTPTPTNTPNTTPTPLVTPTTSPNNFGVWWACTQFNESSAWACEPVSNGIFVFEQYLSQSGLGYANSEQYYSIHAPTSIYSATLLCGYTAEHAGGPHTVHNATTQSTGSAIINRSGNWSATDETGSTLYRAYRGTNTTSQNEWGTYVWGFPTTGTAARTHIWGLRSYISVTGYGADTTSETASGGTLIHCQVERYMLYTGEHHNWNDESTATPTPAPTGTPTPVLVPTATGGWGSVPWDPAPWVSTPSPADFEIGDPGLPSCTTLLPGYGYTGTIFGYSIDIGWDAFTICFNERTFQLEFYGWDMGSIAVSLLVLLAFVSVYQWIRLG